MKKLTPIELEDGTVIYMEVKEDVELVPEESIVDEGERELTRGDLGKDEKGWGGQTRSPQEQIRQSFQAIEGTIRAYTNHTLDEEVEVWRSTVEN